MSKGIMDRYLRRFALVAMFAMFSILHVGLAEAESGNINLELKYIGFGLGYHTGTATVTVGNEIADYKVSGTQLVGIGFPVFGQRAQLLALLLSMKSAASTRLLKAQWQPL